MFILFKISLIYTVTFKKIQVHCKHLQVTLLAYQQKEASAISQRKMAMSTSHGLFLWLKAGQTTAYRSNHNLHARIKNQMTANGVCDPSCLLFDHFKQTISNQKAAIKNNYIRLQSQSIKLHDIILVCTNLSY